MGVEQIGVGAHRTKKELDHIERVLAVTKPRPKIDAPTDAPSRSVVAADFQGASGCRGELGSPVHVDLPARIEAIEVRDVPVMDVRRPQVPVLQLFPQLRRAFYPAGVFSLANDKRRLHVGAVS